MSVLADQLDREWYAGEDRARAALTARAIAMAVEMRPVALEEHYDVVSRTAEFFWDTGRISEARALANTWAARVEEALAAHPTLDPVGPRVHVAILRARVAHRAARYLEGIVYVRTALRMLREAVGGQLALEALARRPQANEIGEMTCATLAIGIPLARMYTKRRPHLREKYVDPWVRLALMIICATNFPPRYKRAHAIVIQTLYALLDRPSANDYLIWQLKRYDDRLRPAHARGRATTKLRDLAIARRLRDHENEVRLAREALEDLRAAGLERHIQMAVRLGLLPDPDDPSNEEVYG